VNRATVDLVVDHLDAESVLSDDGSPKGTARWHDLAEVVVEHAT
jgi:hypothetical protein